MAYSLQQAGKSGFYKMISEDISLNYLNSLFQPAATHQELEAITQSLEYCHFVLCVPLQGIKTMKKRSLPEYIK